MLKSTGADGMVAPVPYRKKVHNAEFLVDVYHRPGGGRTREADYAGKRPRGNPGHDGPWYRWSPDRWIPWQSAGVVSARRGSWVDYVNRRGYFAARSLQDDVPSLDCNLITT